MIQGSVSENHEAIVPVVVKNNTQLKATDAVIDTGFNGFLSLPIAIIIELNLSWKYRERATLGDGSETLLDIYEANIIWDGQSQEIEINAADTEPLLGMKMLQGYRLQIDAIEGGSVIIQKLFTV